MKKTIVGFLLLISLSLCFITGCSAESHIAEYSKVEKQLKDRYDIDFQVVNIREKHLGEKYYTGSAIPKGEPRKIFKVILDEAFELKEDGYVSRNLSVGFEEDIESRLGIKAFVYCEPALGDFDTDDSNLTLEEYVKKFGIRYTVGIHCSRNDLEYLRNRLTDIVAGYPYLSGTIAVMFTDNDSMVDRIQSAALSDSSLQKEYFRLTDELPYTTIGFSNGRLDNSFNAEKIER